MHSPTLVETLFEGSCIHPRHYSINIYVDAVIVPTGSKSVGLNKNRFPLSNSMRLSSSPVFGTEIAAVTSLNMVLVLTVMGVSCVLQHFM